MTYPNEPPLRVDALSCDSDEPEKLRLIAVGSLHAVNYHIHQMYQLRYAEPFEWSKPIPTVNPQEVMRILTKRVPPKDEPT